MLSSPVGAAGEDVSHPETQGGRKQNEDKFNFHIGLASGQQQQHNGMRDFLTHTVIAVIITAITITIVTVIIITSTEMVGVAWPEFKTSK